MKKIFNLLLLGVVALSMQSCLHDDNEVFDQPAAVRIQVAVQDVKDKLVSSPNGWMMHFYTGTDFTGGGYNMLMRFTKSYAYVSSDYVAADAVTHSTWDVKKDQGPVITFDSYNEILHALSNPSAGAIDGEEADYEFVVLSMTDNEIRVRGKKWGNHMVMTRLSDDFNWEEYLSSVKASLKALGPKYETPQGTKVYFNTASRRLTTETDGIGTAFYMDQDGLHFPEPYELDGAKLDGLSFDPATAGITSTAGMFKELVMPLSEWFANFDWFMIADGASASALNDMKNFKNAATSYKNEICAYFCLGTVTTNVYGAIMAFGTDDNGYTAAALGLNCNIIDDTTITLAMSGSLYGTAEYWNTYPIQQKIMQLVTGGYGPTRTWLLSVDEDDNIKNPKRIRMTDKSTPTRYFYVSKEEVDYPFENI